MYLIFKNEWVDFIDKIVCDGSKKHKKFKASEGMEMNA